jgi:hypothetical protein
MRARAFTHASAHTATHALTRMQTHVRTRTHMDARTCDVRSHKHTHTHARARAHTHTRVPALLVRGLACAMLRVLCAGAPARFGLAGVAGARRRAVASVRGPQGTTVNHSSTRYYSHSRTTATRRATRGQRSLCGGAPRRVHGSASAGISATGPPPQPPLRARRPAQTGPRRQRIWARGSSRPRTRGGRSWCGSARGSSAATSACSESRFRSDPHARTRACMQATSGRARDHACHLRVHTHAHPRARARAPEPSPFTCWLGRERR